MAHALMTVLDEGLEWLEADALALAEKFASTRGRKRRNMDPPSDLILLVSAECHRLRVEWRAVVSQGRGSHGIGGQKYRTTYLTPRRLALYTRPEELREVAEARRQLVQIKEMHRALHAVRRIAMRRGYHRDDADREAGFVPADERQQTHDAQGRFIAISKNAPKHPGHIGSNCDLEGF